MTMPSIIACATCANNFADNGPNAAGWSILFMLGVIVLMMTGVAFFMIRIALRSRNSLDPELRDDFETAAVQSH
ncbi:hypothetical protein HAHE_32420 [Haloferula helveola]|uniref:CcmD family protein n=2 Tax=Haloferula helveola TaxID=490095 RepID=A0ABM7RPR7_9BACT|nr:hypothetical protein HAHE_32420 [Haloferula helveola]